MMGLGDLMGGGMGAPAPQPPSMMGLGDLMGGGMGVPAPAMMGFDDFLGGGMTAPTPAAQFPPVIAYNKDGVIVSLAFSKPDPVQPGLTDALATVTYGGGSLVGNFSLQVAVPKFMQLRLDPASGNALQPGGPPITQSIHLTNSAHGQKAVVLRLRLSYVVNGHTTVEMAEVNNLPPGL